MISEIHNFGHLMIARRAGGEPVALVRSPDEIVFLAFDTSIRRLVELHILQSGQSLDSVAKKSAFDRARLAAEIRGQAFMRILDVGEERGLVYYTSNLSDGEFVEAYIERRGALHPAIVFSLLIQLLDELIPLKLYWRVVSRMRLDRVLVTTLEDAFLQMRIYDYAFSNAEAEGTDDNGSCLVEQACRLMFLMLTGRPYDGENPDRQPVLTALPAGLRMTMRTALLDPGSCHNSLERLRDEVKEALSAVVTGIQSRNSRRHLALIAALQPRSQLQDILLENVPAEQILGSRFRPGVEGVPRRYPFSIPCLNAKNDQAVMVHLLPPARIVAKEQYEAMPMQMWRFNSEQHPNILRSLSVWESPEWTFLTEDQEPGFALSRLLAERLTLNPNEALIVLRQVQAGVSQAMECGVPRLDLHPSNIVMRVGRNGPLAARDHERLMQKRLDAWPAFQIKLRAHLTMRNLYEPPLVDAPEGGEMEDVDLADRDYRNRAFVVLVAYLLTGQRQTGWELKFPEATPEPLVDYLLEVLGQVHLAGRTPDPASFLQRFELLLNGPVAAPSLAARLRGSAVPLEEMESAGSISDFENEWGDDDGCLDSPVLAPLAGKKGRTVSYGPPLASPWTWAAVAALVLLLTGGVWLLGGGSSAAAGVATGHMAKGLPDVPKPAEIAEKKVPLPSLPESQAAPLNHGPLSREPWERSGRPVMQPVSGSGTPAAAEAAQPSVGASSPAEFPEPAKDEPEPLKAAAKEETPAPAAPPLPVPSAREPEQVIRRAIVPTAEEIARFKESLKQAAKPDL